MSCSFDFVWAEFSGYLELYAACIGWYAAICSHFQSKFGSQHQKNRRASGPLIERPDAHPYLG